MERLQLLARAGKVLRLIVIAPLGYRLRNKGKMLYRQAAYLICTDPGLPLEQVLQIAKLPGCQLPGGHPRRWQPGNLYR